MMCKDDTVENSDKFYLDAFANSTTSRQCICILQARGMVEIGFEQHVISGDPCVTSLTLYSNFTIDHVFSCRNDSSRTTLTTDQYSMVIELKSSSASPESAYCLQIYKRGGTGEANIVFFILFYFIYFLVWVFCFIVRVFFVCFFFFFFFFCMYVYIYICFCICAYVSHVTYKQSIYRVIHLYMHVCMHAYIHTYMGEIKCMSSQCLYCLIWNLQELLE